MENFLYKTVSIRTFLGGTGGLSRDYTGLLTSYDDEFVCLDNTVYIATKFIMIITLK